MKTYPDDVEVLIPIKCLGRFNCLYNAVSIILSEKTELHLEHQVKAKTVMNGLTYELFKFNIYSSASSDGFEEDVFKALAIRNYNDLRYIAALCNVLNCTVNSIY